MNDEEAIERLSIAYDWWWSQQSGNGIYESETMLPAFPWPEAYEPDNERDNS